MRLRRTGIGSDQPFGRPAVQATMEVRPQGAADMRPYPVVCVLTRFGLRSPLDLFWMYVDHRRARDHARRVDGFLASAFLIGGARTCFTLSLWASYEAIPRFGTAVPEHAEAARRSMGRVRMNPGRGPEIWSTKWQLQAPSHNLNWDTFDLRQHLG